MTEQAEEIRALVREKYGAIARKEASCCGSACDGAADGLDMIGDAYESVEGHLAEADLGLGCGVPTEHAGIKPGDTVLDLVPVPASMLSWRDGTWVRKAKSMAWT